MHKYGKKKSLFLNSFIYYQSRRRKLEGHMALMRTGEVHVGFWWGKLRERDKLEDLG